MNNLPSWHNFSIYAVCISLQVEPCVSDQDWHSWNRKEFDRRSIRCFSSVFSVSGRYGASCPLDWPSHAMALHTSGTPLITLPPLLSILAFPPMVSSIIHECLFCSAHTNQSPNPSGIHYMGASSAASNLQLLSPIRGTTPTLYKQVMLYTGCHYESTINGTLVLLHNATLKLCIWWRGGVSEKKKKTMSSIPSAHSFIHKGAQLTIWTLWLLSIVCISEYMDSTSVVPFWVFFT